MQRSMIAKSQSIDILSTVIDQIDDIEARFGENIHAREELQKIINKFEDELEVTALALEDTQYEEDHVANYYNGEV